MAYEASTNTFVFITPYVWPLKDKWIDTKKETRLWKDVIVIDGQVLEEWIEQFPSVGAWLSKFLQIPTGNIYSLDQFWEEWSKNLKYSISSTLVVSGRENEVKKLTDFIIDAPNILSIKASTLEESIAFIAATVVRMDADIKEGIYSKAIIVESDQDFRLVSSNKNPMILIVRFEVGSLVDQAVRNGHHVILAVSNDVTAAKGDIELSRIKRTGFEKGLEEMGFTSDEADQLTRDSGQSLSVLRRLLKFERNQQPAWAKNGHHLEIIPALMVGMWDEQKEEDKSLISLLAGEPYEKYISKLARWKLEKDSPIFQIKSIWRVTSFLDAWSILSPFLTKSDLDNFSIAFLFVLPEINPALELDPDKRYLASLYGKTPKFSHALKEGLCQSLILMAVFGEQFRLTALTSPQGFADKLVHDLLFETTADKWCTLHRLLPLLAEASPKSFLESVENSLASDNPSIMKMFGDIDNLFNSTSYYTGLLWALENLIFSPEYLLRATLILGHLSKLDPGGKLRNRPINTLRDTFIPWYRQTEADFSTKKNVLEKLAEKEPDIAWQLLLSISPDKHAVVSPIHKCKWRFDSQHLKRTVTYEQIWDFQSFLFNKLLSLAKENEDKISVLVNFYPNINFEERRKLLQFLKESKNAHHHTQNLIWNKLRKLLSRHREHYEQDWALPSEELDKIEEIYKLYTPQDLKKQYQYLFEESVPCFPEGISEKKMSPDEREKFLNERRIQAFKKIYESEGLDGILETIKNLTNIQLIARTAARFNLSEEEEKRILGLLDINQTNKFTLFAQSYIFLKAISCDERWINFAWEHIKSINTNEETVVYFFLSLPQERANWDLLDSASNHISKMYWRKVHPNLYQDKLEDKLYAIAKLQEVNRHISIVNEVADIAENISSAFLYGILIKAATIHSDDQLRLDTYSVERIFEILHTRNDLDRQRLTHLEWIYLAFLTDTGSNHRPKSLLHELTTNPQFFVEVVTYVYLPDEGKEEESFSEEELTRRYQKANSARSLLDSWREIPGVKEDGTINKEELITWISVAREKAKENNRVEGVDSQIGNLLACFPRNDTSWPPEEICEIIDTLNNDFIVSHFKTEVFNSRGISIRMPYEGGNQERYLAGYFEKMGKQILPKWPLTASALLDLAEGYKRDAKDEDESAQLDELR